MAHWQPSVDPMQPMPDLSFGMDDDEEGFLDRLAASFASRPIQAPPPEMQVSPLAAFLTNFGASTANRMGDRYARRQENSPKSAANRIALGRINLDRQRMDRERAEQDSANRIKQAEKQSAAEEKRALREEKAAAAELARRESDPSTPEYAAARRRRAQVRRDELEDQVSIYRSLGMRPPGVDKPEKAKTPPGMMVDEEGNIVPKPVAAKGAEKQTLAFYMRAKDAVDNIEATDQSGRSLEQRVASGPGQAQLQHAPDLFKTPEQRMYRQAQRAFTEARLRKESGAAIPKQEYENDSRIYFAQPGDDAATLRQKQRARKIVLDGLANASGPAYEEWFGEKYPRRGTMAPADSSGWTMRDGIRVRAR